MSLPFPTHLVHLRDQRYLCVVECGDPQGVPAFYFHGGPGSRIGGLAFHESAAKHGVRLFVPDRPGMGFSEQKPGRTVASFADDVEDVADWFGLDTFGVFGASGGAPYAVGMAYRLPERLTTAVAASVPGPMADDERFLEGLPRAARLFIKHAARSAWAMRGAALLLTQPSKEAGKNKFTEKMANDTPTSDLEVQRWLEANPHLQSEHVEVHRQGLGGAAEDLRCIMGRSWGFQLADVKGHVHVWHGKDDGAMPVQGARLMAGQLQSCDLHVVEGGHNIPFTYCDDIFTVLSSAAAGLR